MIVAAGPIGRNAEASGSASLKHIAAVYSYSKTRGFFAGISLEGSVVLTRNNANEKFYGRRVTAKELLNGSVPPPPEADALYRALNAKFHNLGSTGSMYQRNSGEESPRSYNFKSTNISAPGTLRQPPPLRQGQQTTPSPYAANNAAPPPPYQSPPSNYGQTYGHQKTPSYGNGGAATTRLPPPPPPPSRKPHEETARALYDFNGEQSGDLSFREGDIITIVQKSQSQDDWWTGRIGGRQGIVSKVQYQTIGVEKN